MAVLDVDFAFVHEVDEGAQFREADVLQDDDGVAIRMVEEQGLEVAGARRENDLVCADRRALRARQRHVHQRLRLQQLIEHTQQVALMIVPPQAVMLTSHV